jgi:hypothetical protein
MGRPHKDLKQAEMSYVFAAVDYKPGKRTGQEIREGGVSTTKQQTEMANRNSLDNGNRF